MNSKRVTKSKRGAKLNRKTQTLQARLTPKRRFEMVLAANYLKRSLSNTVELAMAEFLENIKIKLSGRFYDESSVESKCVIELADELFDDNDAVCFVNLAKKVPSLLSENESRIWNFICGEESFWLNDTDLNIDLIKLMWIEFGRFIFENDMFSISNYNWSLHEKSVLQLTENEPEEKRKAFSDAIRALYPQSFEETK